MVLIKGGQMKQKIIKPGVVRRIAEKIADEGINIPKETVDICLTAFLDTVADILSEGDSVARFTRPCLIYPVKSFKYFINTFLWYSYA